MNQKHISKSSCHCFPHSCCPESSASSCQNKTFHLCFLRNILWWCSSTKCYIITDDESSNQRKKDLWGCQGSGSGGWLRRGLETSEAGPFLRVSTNQRPVFRSRDQYWPIRGQGIGAGGWVEVTPPRPQSGLWLAGEAAQSANRSPALENNHRQLQYLAQGVEIEGNNICI